MVESDAGVGSQKFLSYLGPAVLLYTEITFQAAVENCLMVSSHC